MAAFNLANDLMLQAIEALPDISDHGRSHK
jgi:hypothetical protein